LHKPCFDEECSKEGSQIAVVAKSYQMTADNMNNERHEVSKTFRIKMREYLKGKISESETVRTKISETCAEVKTGMMWNVRPLEFSHLSPTPSPFLN
jgi:hypothetical protein